MPRQSSSARQNQECSISEPTGNQPNNEETTIETNTNSKQQTHVRRRRRKGPYRFGSRRRRYKKKVIKIEDGKENTINEKEDETGDVEQNGTVVTDGSVLDDTLDTSINSHDPENDINIHDKEGRSKVEDEVKRSEELNNDSSSEGAGDDDKGDAVQNGDLHQPECALRANCSYASREERKSTKSLPNGLTATISIRDIGEEALKEVMKLQNKGTYVQLCMC